MKLSAFKIVRIALLLFVLLIVWTTTTSQINSVQSWQGTLPVVIMPIAADNKPGTHAYIKRLTANNFADIPRFVDEQGRRYLKDFKHAIDIRVDNTITSLPPLPPQENTSVLKVVLWSLKLRWWAFRNKPAHSDSTQIKLYVLYSSPAEKQLLPHSTGLQKGLIGIIHARAYPKEKAHNQIVITHELMHIFGASDKYDLSTGRPIFPNGYAEPNKTPRYPQRIAEIMAARVATSPSEFERPKSLRSTIVGEQTAKEIGWLKE